MRGVADLKALFHGESVPPRSAFKSFLVLFFKKELLPFTDC
jgi:hypothetical protein